MKKKLFIFLILFSAVFAACRKGDTVTTDGSARLAFNTGLVEFDTVFTNIGSATMNFKVKNTNKNAVKTNISLAMGSGSFFRINVDGQPGTSFPGKELRGGDSMYVFIEVTIDPRNQSNPFIIRDSILFETNGNIQYIKLQAWGQDALYLKDVGIFSGNAPFPIDKPIVFVDYIQIPPDSTLIIPAGAKIYCHPGTIVDVFGTLQINGTKNNPVVIQGDRLERIPAYQKGPGQWQGILFRPGSKNNIITHAIIQNADFGIYDSTFDALGTATTPKLAIHQSIIRNMTLYGIVSLNSWVSMDNTLIYNTGGEAFTAWGGQYDFVHCTLDNSSADNVFNRQNPTLLITDARLQLANGKFIGTTVSFHAYDDIVWGSLDDEFYADITNTTKSDTIFRKCDIKVLNFNFGYANYNTDPAFYNVSEEDYHLSAGSKILTGFDLSSTPYSSITTDIEDNIWAPHHPGCYFTTK